MIKTTISSLNDDKINYLCSAVQNHQSNFQQGIKKVQQKMGVEEMVKIMADARTILVKYQPEYHSLIKRIDLELNEYFRNIEKDYRNSGDYGKEVNFLNSFSNQCQAHQKVKSQTLIEENVSIISLPSDSSNFIDKEQTRNSKRQGEPIVNSSIVSFGKKSQKGLKQSGSFPLNENIKAFNDKPKQIETPSLTDNFFLKLEKSLFSKKQETSENISIDLPEKSIYETSKKRVKQVSPKNARTFYQKPYPEKQGSQNTVRQQLMKKCSEMEIVDYFILDFSFLKEEYEVFPPIEAYGKRGKLYTEIRKQIQKGVNQSKNSLQYNNQLQKIRLEPPEQKSYLNQISEAESAQAYEENENQISPVNLLNASKHSSQRPDHIVNSMEVQAAQSLQLNPLCDPLNPVPQTTREVMEIYESRKVIINLIFSKQSDHHSSIKKTPSMTEIHTMTSNPSKTFRHLIVPSFLEIRTKQNQSHCNRYTHIIQTEECVKINSSKSSQIESKYYRYERFYVIVERENRPQDVERIIRGLNRKYFELRQKEEKSVESIPYSTVRKCVTEVKLLSFLQISMIPKEYLYRFYHFSASDSLQRQSALDLSQSQPHCPISHQLQLYCKSILEFKFLIEPSPNSPSSFLNNSISLNLLTILTYFVIHEFKIIFLASKGYENYISESVMAMTHSLGQLRYVYPVILASLTNHHIEFINSPVPALMGFWGKQSRHKKMVEMMRKSLIYESEIADVNEPSIPTICVDINRHEFVGHIWKNEEIYVIEELNRWVGRKCKGRGYNQAQDTIETMNRFFNEEILGLGDIALRSKQQQIGIKKEIEAELKSDHKKQFSDARIGGKNWKQILRQRVKATQMYEQYMKLVEEKS